jgi:hypothetical protein
VTQHIFATRCGIGRVTSGQSAPDPDTRMMAEVEQIRALRARGFEVGDIARQLGMSYKRVAEFCRRFRIMKPRPQPQRIRADSKPQVADEQVTRRCLSCGTVFVAQSRFLRLCEPHRRGA